MAARRFFRKCFRTYHSVLLLSVLSIACSDHDRPPDEGHQQSGIMANAQRAAKSGQGHQEQITPEIQALDTLQFDTEDPEKFDDFHKKRRDVENEKQSSSAPIRLQAAEKTYELAEAQLKIIAERMKRLKQGGRECKEEIKAIEAACNKEKEDHRKVERAHGITDFILCQACNTQMGVHKTSLLKMDTSVFGQGVWHRCDKGSNKLPGAIDYRNLKEFLREHPATRGWHVPSCIYCYKKKAIERIKGIHTKLKTKYEALSADYTKYANALNGEFKSNVETLKMEAGEH